jgi:hypothetical protein
VVGSATRGTAIRSNFGIKSFYPKIGGMCWHQNLVQERTPRSEFVKGKPKYSTRSTNQVAVRMTLSYQGMGPIGKDNETWRKNTSDFIKGKDWSRSYLNLGNFVFFSRFLWSVLFNQDS